MGVQAQDKIRAWLCQCMCLLTHLIDQYHRDVVLGLSVDVSSPQCLPKLSRSIIEEGKSSFGAAEGVRLAQHAHEIFRTNGGDRQNAAIWAYVCSPAYADDALVANRFIEGNSVVVAHHDTLTIERRFSRHSAEVQLLAVDTQSATMGNGRFAVSYDVDMTAIVWDLMTGEEVARFASYENLTCAAWMRNGNVAFGMLLVMDFARSRIADFNTRQRARKCYSLRTYDLRAHICPHH